MSKADELLKQVVYQSESYDISYNKPNELKEVDKLLEEIDKYLNDKDDNDNIAFKNAKNKHIELMKER